MIAINYEYKRASALKNTKTNNKMQILKIFDK